MIEVRKSQQRHKPCVLRVATIPVCDTWVGAFTNQGAAAYPRAAADSAQHRADRGPDIQIVF